MLVASPGSSSSGWNRSGGQRSVPSPILPRAATSWRYHIQRCPPTTYNDGLADNHNIICSSRNESIRVSLHVYNDDHDLTALVGGLRRLAAAT